MAIIQVNAGQPLPPGLLQRAAEMAPGAPLVVMIHGYRYCPADPARDPHRHILSPQAQGPGSRRSRPWPQALGFSAEGAEGMAIAFGWPALGRLSSAYGRAGLVGQGLGALLARLSQAASRPVQLIGHSLGARVAMQALGAAPAGSIGRMVLLAAAELRPAAEAALDSPAGRRAEIINITSRENDLFDFAVELLVGHARRTAVGFGLSQPRPNWLDVQIDAAEVREGLATLGFDIGAGIARACHWSPYLREGLFDFYRVVLTRPWALPMGLLRLHLPARQSPRWSRLLQPPGRDQSSFFLSSA